MIYYALLLTQLVTLAYLGHRNMHIFFTALHRITDSTSVSFWIIALLYFPGTLVHELSHLITSVILLVPPTHINLLPSITENDNSYSVRLGYVQHVKTDPIRSCMIGIAPFFVGFLFFYLVNSFNLFPHHVWYNNLILFYLFLTISSTMFPSKQDLKESYVLIFFLVGAIALIYMLDVPIVNYLLSEGAVKIVRNLNIYLALGTGANLLVRIFLKLITSSK